MTLWKYGFRAVSACIEFVFAFTTSYFPISHIIHVEVAFDESLRPRVSYFTELYSVGHAKKTQREVFAVSCLFHFNSSPPLPPLSRLSLCLCRAVSLFRLEHPFSQPPLNESKLPLYSSFAYCQFRCSTKASQHLTSSSNSFKERGCRKDVKL